MKPSTAARVAIVALLALSLVACGDDDVTPLIHPDGGPDMNVPDLGRPTPDLGPACTPANITPLTAAELPRCTAATHAAVIACGIPTTDLIATCISDATDADTTTATGTPPNDINCSTCLNLQRLSCFYTNGCNAELDTYFCCVTAAGCTGSTCPACATQLTAAQTCIGGAADCFDSSIGAAADCFAVDPTDAGTPTDAGPATTDAGHATTDAGPATTDAGPAIADAGPG